MNTDIPHLYLCLYLCPPWISFSVTDPSGRCRGEAATPGDEELIGVDLGWI